MNDAAGPESLRVRMFDWLTRDEVGFGGAALRSALVALIVVSVTAAILRTVPGIAPQWATTFDAILLLATAGFALEYLLRIWVAPGDKDGAGAAGARLRYVFSLPGLIDLVAALPFTLAPHLGMHIDWLDIVPIFKLLRYSHAFQFLVEAIYGERRVLASAAILTLALLIFQSTIVYFFERDAQPDKFGSIPEAMWWGIVTLTTVGYGDVTPVTVGGRVAGGITAVLGVCMFAIPVGIIASAFVEAVRRREFVVTWNLVANVPLFRDLDAGRIAAIAALLRTRQAERGERLVRKGDEADSMYFIVSGEVEVDTGSAAGSLRMAAGEFFGEVALIANRVRTATVTAATGCKLLVLHKRDFHGFMEAHAELAALVRATALRRIEEIDAPRLRR